MSKSPDAFRTISEVADWLGVQAHVLRFWESKFSQVKPIKRAGGRRYYRPADMLLIGGIKKLLHDDGLTIKGVQKILREQGMSHVADQSQPLDDLTSAVLDGTPAHEADIDMQAEPDTAEVLEFTPPETELAPEPEPEVPTIESQGQKKEEASTPAEETAQADEVADRASPDATIEQTHVAPMNDVEEPLHSVENEVEASAPDFDEQLEIEATSPETTALDGEIMDDATRLEPNDGDDATPPQSDTPETWDESESDAVPSFMRRPLQEPTEAAPAQTSESPAPELEPDPEPEPEKAAPKPRAIDLPQLPVESDMPATPAALSALARIRSLNPDQASALRPLLEELTALRDQMAQHGKSAHKD